MHPHPDPSSIGCPKVASAYRQFLKLFGPTPATPVQFKPDVRQIVYARMIYAFHPAAKTSELRRYFRLTFHPDTGPRQLSDYEKCQIFVAGDAIFAAEEVRDV